MGNERRSGNFSKTIEEQHRTLLLQNKFSLYNVPTFHIPAQYPLVSRGFAAGLKKQKPTFSL